MMHTDLNRLLMGAADSDAFFNWEGWSFFDGPPSEAETVEAARIFLAEENTECEWTPEALARDFRLRV